MPRYNEIDVCIYHPVGKPNDKTYKINGEIVEYADVKKLKHADANGYCYAQIEYYNTISDHTVIQILTYRKYNVITGLFEKPFAERVKA